ncbi:MAG: pyrimidine dimer DNA glycosylase/endonuclease V [Candidatus Bathyarchaeia archaeon]
MVSPRFMCRQHLLGEHVEIHMFIGTLTKNKTVKGYLEKGLLEVHSLYARHEELVKEMTRRGYKHCSSVDECWRFVDKLGVVDRKKSLEDLLTRCPRCSSRYSENK